MNSTKSVLIIGNSYDDVDIATVIKFMKLDYKVAFVSDKERNDRDKSINSILADSSVCNNYLALHVKFQDETLVDLLIPSVVSKFGGIDILVNNVGFQTQHCSLLEENFLQEFHFVMQTTLYASTRIAQLAAPYLMKAPEGGVIINVVLSPNSGTLCSTSSNVAKAGLDMLTKTLANSFEQKNVRCLTILQDRPERNWKVPSCPNQINSPFVDLSGGADELANLISFVASNKASYINGTSININVGT